MSSQRHIDAVAGVRTTSRVSAGPADYRYLDAAREVILDVGWSRATLTDVARRAGVSRMTLYRRWSDTRALVADLMTREWQRVAAAAVEGGRPTDPDGIAAAVVAVVAGLRANPLLRRVVELDPEVLLPYLLRRRGRGQEQLAALVAGLVEAGQQAGAVRPGDPVAMARTLVLTLQGPTLAAYVDEAEPGAELHHLVRGFLLP